MSVERKLAKCHKGFGKTVNMQTTQAKQQALELLETDPEFLAAAQRKIGQIHAAKRKQTHQQMSINGKKAADARWNK